MWLILRSVYHFKHAEALELIVHLNYPVWALTSPLKASASTHDWVTGLKDAGTVDPVYWIWREGWRLFLWGWMSVRCLARVSLLPLTSTSLEFIAKKKRVVFYPECAYKIFFPISFFYLYDWKWEVGAYVSASVLMVSSWLLTPGNLNTESVFICHIHAALPASSTSSVTNMRYSELFITLYSTLTT